jgi:hypothetical protein
MAKFFEEHKSGRQSRKIIGFLILLVFSYLFVAAITTFAQGYEIWGKSWNEVPGGGTVDTNLATATFKTGNYNSLYLFQKGIDTHIYANIMDGITGSWGGWSEVPGNGVTNVALTAATFSNKLYLFHTGQNARIYFNTLDAGGNWGNSWSEVPGNGVTDVAMTATVHNNKLYLFHTGQNTRIYYNTLGANGNWETSWSEVPGNGVTNAPLDAIGFDFYRLFIFHAGQDKKIYYNTLAHVVG